MGYYVWSTMYGVRNTLSLGKGKPFEPYPTDGLASLLSSPSHTKIALRGPRNMCLSQAKRIRVEVKKTARVPVRNRQGIGLYLKTRETDRERPHPGRRSPALAFRLPPLSPNRRRGRGRGPNDRILAQCGLASDLELGEHMHVEEVTLQQYGDRGLISQQHDQQRQ